MYKNYRVGRIKYVSSKKSGRQILLLDAIESCTEMHGSEYIARYNLCVVVSENIIVTRSDVGRFCEVGFYIQSFRVKDLDAAYDTILSMKSLRFFADEEEAVAVAVQISKSISNINN